MKTITKKQLAESIGRNIAHKCREFHLTQKQLAEMSGLTEAGISRYISGERLPRIDILLRIATALNCTLDYLLYGVEV